jgi:hypothetical protein
VTYQTAIEWIEACNTLHRQVEILYVVDGYQVSITYDSNYTNYAWRGSTLLETINKARLEYCPRHVASDADGKICRFCETHIDTERPD